MLKNVEIMRCQHDPTCTPTWYLPSVQEVALGELVTKIALPSLENHRGSRRFFRRLRKWLGLDYQIGESYRIKCEGFGESHAHPFASIAYSTCSRFVVQPFAKPSFSSNILHDLTVGSQVIRLVFSTDWAVLLLGCL